MKFEPTPIPGALLIEPNTFVDNRGEFVKVFHDAEFRQNGIPFHPTEEFFSISHRSVIRGMHFQLPPFAHDKLVYCLSGRILDVIVDLRKGSPTYGRHFSCELTSSNRWMLFIPVGLAHGFLCLDDASLVMYSVTTTHNPVHDCGIRWDSFGMKWPCVDPIVSARDKSFKELGCFDSPFIFTA